MTGFYLPKLMPSRNRFALNLAVNRFPQTDGELSAMERERPTRLRLSPAMVPEVRLCRDKAARTHRCDRGLLKRIERPMARNPENAFAAVAL